MKLDRTIAAVKSAATAGAVRAAVVAALGGAGELQLEELRRVIDAASDRLYEIATPGYVRPTGVMEVR